MYWYRYFNLTGKSFRFGAKLVGITVNKDKKIMDEEDNSQDKCEDESMLSEYMNLRKINTKLEEGSSSMLYEEKLVDCKSDIIEVLKSMNKKNLFIVGRMPPVAPLVNKSDCLELGPVGSFLASSEFSTVASVVVIQQYNSMTDLHPLVIEEITTSPHIQDIPPDSPSTK